MGLSHVYRYHDKRMYHYFKVEVDLQIMDETKTKDLLYQMVIYHDNIVIILNDLAMFLLHNKPSDFNVHVCVKQYVILVTNVPTIYI